MRFCILFLLIIYLIPTSSLVAQKQVTISIVHDGDRGTRNFINIAKKEIDALLTHQFNIIYKDVNIESQNQNPTQIINSALSDESDILITMGIKSSQVLNSIGAYPKPSIAGISLERLDAESTGINNYTLVQSPFSVSRDFEVFQSIVSFKKLAVFIQPRLQSGLEPYIGRFANGFDIQYIPISDDPGQDLNKLNDDIDAIYFLPNLYNNLEANQALIDGINERNLPSFSLIGRNDVQLGILASISPSDYIGVYGRRIALNVMKILEGQNAKDLPIAITGIEDDFVINVSTMEKLEVYPPFEILSQASLINLEPQIGKQYTLKSALAEALNSNLSFLSAQKNVDIQKTNIGIAKSNLLPNLSANANLISIDGSSADLLKSANQLTPQTEWSGNLEISQLLFSQPALANVAIQKALLKSEEAGLLSRQLDLALDVCTSYLQYLQSQANQNIQNKNVQTTLRNLNIAKTKAKIGTISNADVYGFESQLALNRSALNDASTSVELAGINFNKLLNRPLDEDFILEDVQSNEKLFFLQDSRIRERVNNHYDFRKFAEFLIEFALKSAPEIEQLQWAIKAQESSLASNKQSLYLPQVAVRGNLDKTFGRYGTKTLDEVFESIGINPYQPTWNIGVNASLPIFQGNLRNKNIQKDQLIIDQLEIDRASLEQQFAANIRLSLENLGNSYNDIQFTEQAEKSSNQYLGIVQDLYREGATNIVTLLDAQNNAVSSQLGAISSKYQFIINAITIERLFNNIYILSTSQERENFINDYFTFLIKKDKND